AFVGYSGSCRIAEMGPHQPQCMPHVGRSRVAAQRLFQSGGGELGLPPASGPEPTFSWAGRIPRRDFGGPVVGGEGFVILMNELERVPELDPGNGTPGAEPSGK